jgi:hypothetical protein
MRNILVIIVLLTAYNATAQIAYHDAVALSDYFSNGKLDASNEMVFTILDQYIQPTVNNTKQQIIDSVNERSSGDPNPFLEISGTITADFNTSRARASLESIGSSIGNLNIAGLADGLAKFLIARAKEELSVAFFDNFKNDLEKIPELKVLFPTTASFIENIEAYNYSYFIQTLRESFHVDLAYLPTGFRNLRMLAPADCRGEKKCEERIQQLNDFFLKDDKSILFTISTIVMDSLQAGGHIANIINAIAKDKQISIFPNSNISNAILLSAIFSESIRSKNDDRPYISKEELKKLENLNVLKLYFGLIYQQCKTKKIRFTNGTTSVSLISLLKPEEIKTYLQYLDNLVNTATEINSMIKEIKNKKNDNVKFTADDYTHYASTTVNFITVLTNWKATFQITTASDIEDLRAIARPAISIYYAIRSANYSSAVSNAVIILSRSLHDTYKYKEKVLRYGAFMSAIVQAEDSDDVSKAIESVALPSGSASIKKNSQWNLSLNAYLGGFGGLEYLAEKKIENWKNTVGITAPIGIAISHRVRTASLTGFISLIDIGTFASYRLKDSTATKLPEVTLQNIFAPGAGLIYGFPKWPVSIGYLFQMGPSIRGINTNAATPKEKNNLRSLLFIAVDIPLSNFYTKPKD